MQTRKMTQSKITKIEKSSTSPSLALTRTRRGMASRRRQVGPLWIRGQEGEGETGDENPASPQACQDVSALSGETLDARSCRAGRGAASARDGSVGDDSAGGARDTRKKGLEDVWAWLEPVRT